MVVSGPQIFAGLLILLFVMPFLQQAQTVFIALVCASWIVNVCELIAATRKANLRRCAYKALLVTGIGLNLIAVGLNDWRMPVASEAADYRTGMHVGWTRNVRAPFLCDWIFGVMSIGDLLLFASLPMAYLEHREKAIQ